MILPYCCKFDGSSFRLLTQLSFSNLRMVPNRWWTCYICPKRSIRHVRITYLIKIYVSSFSVMSEKVSAAVVSFDNTVKMLEFIIEFVDTFNKSKEFVKGFKLFTSLLICFSFESVVELSWSWERWNISVKFAFLNKFVVLRKTFRDLRYRSSFYGCRRVVWGVQHSSCRRSKRFEWFCWWQILELISLTFDIELLI